jgi:hypothetical protein
MRFVFDRFFCRKVDLSQLFSDQIDFGSTFWQKIVEKWFFFKISSIFVQFSTEKSTLGQPFSNQIDSRSTFRQKIARKVVPFKSKVHFCPNFYRKVDLKPTFFRNFLLQVDFSAKNVKKWFFF